MSSSHLQGMRVLIAEDQMIVAMDLEDMVHGCGCEVLGPVATLASAMELVGRTLPDAAILDINLDGTLSYPLAETLCAQKIPVILATGYGASRLPQRWQGLPRLNKPFTRESVEALLGSVLKSNGRK